MKFLVFALCVCAVSAASFDNKPFGSYKPYQPVQSTPFRQVAEPTVIGGKTVYNAGKYVAGAPVAAGKTVYNAGQYVSSAPAKSVYNAGQYVASVPIAAAKTTYNAAKYVATVPVAEKTYDVEVVPETPIINTRTADAVQEVAGPVVVGPVVPAAPVYEDASVVVEPEVRPVAKTYSAVAKPVYSAPKAVYNYDKDISAGILRSETNVGAEGFNYVYETANGIAASASGALKNVENTPSLVFEGSYQYPAPDGTLVQVSYTADENGFQPRSDFLPVGPPVPEAILRSLEYIRTHAKPENYNY